MLMLDRAQKYAAVGWPVFPLAPGTKKPLIKSAHPPNHPCKGECGNLGHGLYDATLDPELIENWWGTDGEAGANIGLRAGVKWWVPDIDAKPPKLGGQTGADHGIFAPFVAARVPGDDGHP